VLQLPRQVLVCRPATVATPRQRALPRLEGLLRREPDPNDPRAKGPVLTKKDLKARTTMMKASAEMFSAMTGLDEAGTKQLLALLGRSLRFNAVRPRALAIETATRRGHGIANDLSYSSRASR
jgi:hypothetical protein